MVGYACFHRWRDSERLVNAAEVVIHEMEGDSALVVLNFLGKAIREPSDRRMLIRIVTRGIAIQHSVRHRTLTERNSQGIHDSPAFFSAMRYGPLFMPRKRIALLK